mgnify:FL=1
MDFKVQFVQKSHASTLGVESSITYTELEFSSDIAKGGCDSVCRYLKPWAMLMAIFIRLSQENWAASPSKGGKQMRSNYDVQKMQNISVITKLKR